MIDARRQSVAPHDADGPVLDRHAERGAAPSAGRRHRQPADADSHPARQGRTRSVRAAEPHAARRRCACTTGGCGRRRGCFPAPSTAGAPTSPSRPRSCGTPVSSRPGAPGLRKRVLAASACGIRTPRTCSRAGADLRTIQLLLGHVEIRHTVLYLHLSQKHLQAVANPLDALTISRTRHRAPDAPEAQAVTRPPFEVADIVRQHGDRFLETHRAWVTGQHRRVLRAIAQCRTAALGGHRDRCDQCAHPALSYNSCRDRHCPKCLTAARNAWVAAREAGAPARRVRPPRLHDAGAAGAPGARQQTRGVRPPVSGGRGDPPPGRARIRSGLGGDIGGLMVLHTWGQRLQHHPHVHCVVPMGGLSPDGTRWIHARPRFFLPDSGPAAALSRQARRRLPGRLSDRAPSISQAASAPLEAGRAPFARSSDPSIASRGSSTPSRPSAARPTCCTTSRATPTASRSRTTGSST